MTELQILNLMLWVFGIAFSVKVAVFGVLAKSMWPAPPGLSRALFMHYAAISAQAFVLAAIYFTYVALLHGGGPGVQWRVAEYITAIPAVIAVDVSGVYLLIKYFQSEHGAEEGRDAVTELARRDANDLLNADAHQG